MSHDLLSRVNHQLAVARSSVTELEYIRDQLVILQADRGVFEKDDYIPGIGMMQRSKAYMTALRTGTRRVNPSYVDEHGEMWTLFHCKQYRRHADKLGIGRAGNGLVLLSITEHAKVRRAINKERPR
jgi:hypothetical protein